MAEHQRYPRIIREIREGLVLADFDDMDFNERMIRIGKVTQSDFRQERARFYTFTDLYRVFGLRKPTSGCIRVAYHQLGEFLRRNEIPTGCYIVGRDKVRFVYRSDVPKFKRVLEERMKVRLKGSSETQDPIL